MTPPSTEHLGQLLVAVIFGPVVAIVASLASFVVAPWVLALGFLNLTVALGVVFCSSRGLRELGAGWIVMSTVLAVLAMGAPLPV